MKGLYALVPVIIVGLLVGWRYSEKKKDAAAQVQQRAVRMSAPAVVTLAVAKVQDVVHTFEYVGSVQPPLSVQIAPKVTGRIDFLQVHEGDRVSKGQVLVRIDPSTVLAQVQQQKAALRGAQRRYAQAKDMQEPTNVSANTQIDQQKAVVASAEADVKTAQANLKNAQLKYQRLKTLYDKGFVAQQDVDDADAAQKVQEATQEAAEEKVTQAQAALKYAESNLATQPAYVQNLAALRADIAAAEGGLKNLEAQLKDTVLICPLDGYVTGRYMDPGAVASPGQAILAVQYMREVWVSVPIPEEVSASVHPGMSARATFDALPGETFTGRVTQLNPSADPASRQFMARVTLQNPDNRIKPGTYARVTLETFRAPHALVVPREAVQHGPADSTYVMVVDRENVAHQRPVTVGTDGIGILAITRGLSSGEKVATMSTFPLKEGQHVHPSDSKERGAAPSGAGRGPGAGRGRGALGAEH